MDNMLAHFNVIIAEHSLEYGQSHRLNMYSLETILCSYFHFCFSYHLLFLTNGVCSVILNSADLVNQKIFYFYF